MITLHKDITLSLVVTAFLALSPLAAAQPTPGASAGYTKQQTIALLNKIIEDAPFVPEKLVNVMEQINNKAAEASFEENLAKAVKTLLGIKITPEQRAELNKINELLGSKLQTYKASGPAFAMDFNGGFIVDTQDPRFTVTYKDAHGNTKTRTYQADISLIGLNIELALRFNAIFFVGTDFNFAETNKVIELGTGFQINPTVVLSFFSDFFKTARYRDGYNGHGWADYMRIAQRYEGNQPRINMEIARMQQENEANSVGQPLMHALSCFDFTYIPFTNIPGGMIILAAVVAPHSPFILSDILSMVRGGTLTPIADAA